jgi:hypothetical protein
MGNSETAQTFCKKNYSFIFVCRTAEGVRFLRNSKVLGMFLKLYREDPARNIS